MAPQAGGGFVHNTFRDGDTSWLIPIGVGADSAVGDKLSATSTLLLNFTDLDTGRGSGADVMPGFTIGVRFYVSVMGGRLLDALSPSMWIIVSSVLLGLIGVVASRIGLTYLTAGGASRDPHAYWALGLVTLLPAWLVAFVGLLGTTPGVRPPLVSGAAWLLSAAAGLIGAIATEAGVRGAGDSVEAHHAPRLWGLGVLAFLPAWMIVLIGHVVG